MKMISSKSISVFIASFLLIPALVFASASASLPTAAKKAQNTQLLFVLLAKKGEIQAIKNKQNEYNLTLTHVNPFVMYFTNSPKRYTGKVLVSKFVQEWNKGDFRKVPPNAVIEAVRMNESYSKEHKHSVSYAVELNHPIYTQSKDELSFTIKQLAGSQNKLPDISKSDYVALFIDNALVCPDCVGY